MDETTSRRMRALRDTLAYLDKAEVPAPHTLAARAAAGALVRTRSLLRAFLLLVESPGVSVTETDVLARVLWEMAITIAWIGTDEDRAGRYRDEGARVAKIWQEKMEQHGRTIGGAVGAAFKAYIAEGQGGKLPSLEHRAIHTRAAREPANGWQSLHEEYDFIYRRLCAAVHHDHRLQALVEPLLGDSALAASVKAATIATGVLLTSASEPLGMPSAWTRGFRLAFTPLLGETSN